MHKIEKVGIVGAGVAGLSCASTLQASGISIDLFEKSRGMGGRLAVRRLEGIGSFDIGAQFMTVSTEVFQAVLAKAETHGRCAPWPGKIVHFTEEEMILAHRRTRWVGKPGMNGWVEDLFPRDKVCFQHPIVKIERISDSWILNGNQEKPYDALVLAIPLTQARALLGSDLSLGENITSWFQGELLEPCFALYVAFEEKVDVPFDGAFVRREASPFSWIARDSSKPGRDGNKEHWVLHAHGAWTREHFDLPPSEVEAAMLKAFSELIQKPLPKITYQGSHRWRYASPIPQPHKETPWDESIGLGLTGDWVCGGRVEGAFLAGRDMAKCLLKKKI